MTTTVAVSEARATLPEILDRVLAGEEVTLTRHGQPVAVLVHPDALRTRRADEAMVAARAVHEVLEKGGETPLTDQPVLDPDRAEQLIAQVEKSRTDR